MTRLRELIEEKGIQQKQAAQDLGLSTSTMNNYVGEKREPDFDMVGRLCDYFGCTADYFLGRSDNRYPQISEEDAKHLEIYHSLPPEIRRAVDGLMAPYAAQAEKEENAG